MNNVAVHQATALDELYEWWEDLHDRSTGSQLASLVVPKGWGSTTVLDAFAARASADDHRLGAVLRLPGREAPDGLGLQVAWLHELLDRQRFLGDLPGQLGLNRAEGVVEAAAGDVGSSWARDGGPGAGRGPADVAGAELRGVQT